MNDPLLDASKVIETLDGLNSRAAEIKLGESIRRLAQAAREIGQSWSRSWFGYQAQVYYRGFRQPGQNAYFDKTWGLNRNISPLSRTSGDWVEYDGEEVIREISERAGNPDQDSFQRCNQEAIRRFSEEREDLLSIIDVETSRGHSEYLVQMQENLAALSITTALEIRNNLMPREGTTEDLRAIQQGWVIPPHIAVLCTVQSMQSTMEAIDALSQTARNLRTHIERRRPLMSASPLGSRVFIGHGRATLWRTLKDFLEERLGLEVDEFSSVSTAGVSTTERLRGMLDGAGFAFLIMTGEDEQADGNLRARENVVHEVGLFQGRLGFEKAIVLLEDGCEEFSNIVGLGQIRFPKGSVEAKFEEIRRVLEREGLLNA